ncbi:MAG: ABC transporter ATP-binding protein [Chloroflexi bacterium]|nr:ABC transporter ATP-binding protein [Chloroflexota bacterium]
MTTQTNTENDAAASADSASTILEVKNLSTQFRTRAGLVKAVDDVSFSVKEREVLAIVGESGCGKSVTALSVMGLIPTPPGEIVGGEIMFGGKDLLQASDDEMQEIRGGQMGMIFQEPMTSLNPVMTIGKQVAEPLRIHLGLSKAAARVRAGELLSLVGLPDPLEKLDDYPHQMSGGQRQRVMIAMAMSCEPKLLIADEATTALDVTVQAQVLELLIRVAEEFGTALIIITHNLGIVARYAHRVNVMYAGKIRESGTAADVYKNPGHPYTAGLLSSVPSLMQSTSGKLQSIEGEIPDLTDLPSGCAFGPRCPYVQDRCRLEDPPLENVGDDHISACWESAQFRGTT